MNTTTTASQPTTCPVCGTTDFCRCCLDCGGSFEHGYGTYGCVCWDEGDHDDACDCADCLGDTF